MNISPDIEQIIENIYKSFIEKRIFLDLKIVLVWVFCAILSIYIPVINSSPVRTVLALPVILFIPGYSLIAALFTTNKDIDLIERIALSFGLSIAVVPLIGLGLNYTPWGIRLDPIVVSLSFFIFAMVLIAQYRRGLLSEGEEYVFPFQMIRQGFQEEFFAKDQTKTDKILSIILIISIISAIFVTIFVIVVPKEGEKFTEFFILGENMKAADYPSKVFVGNSYPLYIGVGNHEYRNVTYTIETYLLNMTFHPEDNTSTISRMNLLDSFNISIPHNETSTQQYTFVPTGTGYNRIEFLLFNETVPNNTVMNMDRINTSYRDLHLWVQIYPEEK